jgi:hypothetical protein
MSLNNEIKATDARQTVSNGDLISILKCICGECEKLLNLTAGSVTVIPKGCRKFVLCLPSGIDYSSNDVHHMNAYTSDLVHRDVVYFVGFTHNKASSHAGALPIGP